MNSAQEFLNSFDQTVFIQNVNQKGKTVKAPASVIVYDRIRFMSNGILREEDLKRYSQQLKNIERE